MRGAFADRTGQVVAVHAGLAGDTPILLADGRTKRLDELRSADRVYGTHMAGRYRRYLLTRVVELRRSVAPAFLVTLGDGTRLEAGADHRLLSERGWKHVTGAEQGSRRRPHLTVNNSLMGIGEFASPPEVDGDYRRGYLCGMIRGDGHLGHYPQGTPGRHYAVVHRFRLALADDEALERSRRYLAGFGVPTREFVFSEATEARRRVNAIRAQSKSAVEAIEELVRWPSAPPSEGWRKGFLAGIFDAEGSCSSGILRISNSDPQILSVITECLCHFGFRAVRETPRTHVNLPVTPIRLVGGLRERARLFHLIRPAITRKTSMEGVALKSDAPLGIISITELGSKIPLYGVVTAAGNVVADGVISDSCRAPAAAGA
ncbi:LAGLIDADG family homing endonuclease [Actinomadura sp. WMMA1423]|uniref:LAGLIDADG family homing endonuclease n=1 Tax=Actinomadura sp. WMMA1423 TaxID=2591108 RepID=UPI0011468B07|nr:LAGLIDADG family homing endonuclease [Actinomadura sp. WMMA1423]